MKLLLGIGFSVLIVAGGVATYHWIAGEKSLKRPRYGIRRAGITERGQPVITDSSIEGMADESMVPR